MNDSTYSYVRLFLVTLLASVFVIPLVFGIRPEEVAMGLAHRVDEATSELRREISSPIDAKNMVDPELPVNELAKVLVGTWIAERGLLNQNEKPSSATVHPDDSKTLHYKDGHLEEVDKAGNVTHTTKAEACCIEFFWEPTKMHHGRFEIRRLEKGRPSSEVLSAGQWRCSSCPASPEGLEPSFVLVYVDMFDQKKERLRAESSGLDQGANGLLTGISLKTVALSRNKIAIYSSLPTHVLNAVSELGHKGWSWEFFLKQPNE